MRRGRSNQASSPQTMPVMTVMPSSTAEKSRRSASSRRSTAAMISTGSAVYSSVISVLSRTTWGPESSARRGRRNQSSTMQMRVTGRASQESTTTSGIRVCSMEVLYLLRPICRTARKASCGISTEPTCFMRFLPSFCFSSSLRLRLMSPP